MDKSLLKKAAMQSVALMVAVMTASYTLQQYQAVEIHASNIISTDNHPRNEDIIEVDDRKVILSAKENPPAVIPGGMAASLAELREQVEDSLMKKLSDHYLVIRKPEARGGKLSLEDLYINHSIKLHMTGLLGDDFESSMIMRVRGEEIFLGDPVYKEIVTQEKKEEDDTVIDVVTRDYGKDLSHGITFSLDRDEAAGLVNCDILIELDQVYAYAIYEDENYYFIDLRRPSDVYDKILVIDPGHGGKDAGALSKDEEYYEKNINLGIALALKEILDRENIKVYYTRTADDKVFLRPRVTLGNAVECDYYISIHCNSNNATEPNGTEVLYYDGDFHGVSNKKLAEIFSQELGKTMELEERGIVLKREKEIFIMDKARVPMILIEMGYLSNKRDLKYLINPDKQKEIAQGIYNGIQRAFEELPAVRKN